MKDFIKIFQEVLRTLQPYNHIPKYNRLNRLMWFYAISCAKYLTLPDVQRIAKEIPNQDIEENEMSTLLERTRAEGKADSIVLLLSSRLGFVPQRIEEQLNAIDPAETAHLNELLLLASKCESLDEFEKALSK